MLVRDRAVHRHTVQACAERGLEGVHLGIELAKPLLDGHRFSGAAGGEHHQTRGVDVQRYWLRVRSLDFIGRG